MGTVILISQFLLSLSLLIILHECGHFFPAKWFKTRVEKFYLFFDPWFSIFKINKGGTEYGIGWLPLGGYVKISGMIDESFDREQMAGPPQPWEFRSKPAWQRLIIMIGGVVVNFILGVLIFSFIFQKWGETYLPNSEARYGIVAHEMGQNLGLKSGDHLLKVGDIDIENIIPNPLIKELVINEARSITVRREGAEQVIHIHDEVIAQLSSFDNKDKLILSPRIPIKVAVLTEGKAAEKNGVKVDDMLLSVNGQDARYHDQLSELSKTLKGQNVELQLLRANDTLVIQSSLDDQGKLGLAVYDWSHYFRAENVTYAFLPSISKGWYRAIEFLGDQLKAFGQMFRGKMKFKDSVGGPIAIASLFGTTWDWYQFWNMTAILSIILAFMNLLPIPGLDGGHVIFLIWELLTGKKVSDKIVEYATVVGFLLLITLFVLITYMDVSRVF